MKDGPINCSETSLMRQGMAHGFEDNDTLYVHWVLSHYCNYRCS